MLKIKLVLLFLLLTSLSCTDRESTSYQTEFTNNSGHNVVITPYLAGAIITGEVVTIAPSEKKVVHQNSMRGISNGAFCYGNEVLVDSFVVSYDATYNMAHYPYGITTSNPKSYLLTHPRNLCSISNYQLIIEDPKKHHRDLRYLYTFTGQDYIDASN